jgi:hypothetical protein
MSMTTPELPEQLIEFLSPPGLEDPVPYRASQAVPEWLKGMQMQYIGRDSDPVGTVKRCTPFVDAITAGYIIPLRRTVKITLSQDGEMQYESIGDNEVVCYQDPAAYRGSPFEKSIVVQFRNSWIIRTPPGYSTLFLPVLNRTDFPFDVLSGLVDTDAFYREVDFPAVCVMRPGTQVVLEQGTPLAQAIPIKREGWRAQTGNWDLSRRLESEVDFLVTSNRYKRHHWQKKEFR